MTEPTTAITEFQLRFEHGFPFGSKVSKFFRASQAKLIWLAPARTAAPPGSWVLHVRLPRYLEERFGLTRQFVVYCVATADLQPRDANRVQTLIRDGDHGLEPDFAMLMSSDDRSVQKIAEWGVERSLGLTLVPVTRSFLEDTPNTASASTLQAVIENWISQRNLYDERDPVTGPRFHGRTGLLRDLSRQLSSGQGHVGVFGLRRIGKTSLLLELGYRLSKQPSCIPVFVDLEATSGSAHAAHRILEELADVLGDQTSLSTAQARRELGVREDWHIIEPKLLIAQMADSLRGLLKRGVLKEQRIILMLDESETLLPNPDEPAAGAIDFFRALRGVAQETQRLTIVLAGVNATPTEAPLLAGEDNPLFGLLSTTYLGPLDQADCVEMLRQVGRRMQVRWDGAAASRIAEHVGSHPLLARLAASDLVTKHPERPLRPNIRQAEPILDDFHIRRSSIFEQMMQSLDRYYPEELFVLDVLGSGDQAYATELLEEDPKLIRHLANYGVLNSDNLSISYPALKRWLRMRHL